MGSCTLKRTPKINQAPVLHLEYSRQALVKIQTQSTEGPSSGYRECAFHLSEPNKAYSKSLKFASQDCQLSYTVLPGLNPRRDSEKNCQDTCFVLFNESYIYVGLYDGHGTNGKEVVDLISQSAQDLFTTISSFIQCNSCNMPPLNVSPIYYTAGLTRVYQVGNRLNSTQVLILITDTTIYCAAVGDSRAVLGTTKLPELVPQAYVGPIRENPLLEQVKKRRNSMADININALQLTFDQKPDLPEELARIKKSGGRVEQITSASNQLVGPYRVWEPLQPTPGLSVSRALGDFDCKRLGIISDPICSQHTLISNDFFLIIASDGLWDALENEEAVNFVENYRNLCRKDVKSAVQGHLINPGNSCIAQMLCEEARVRWFSIVTQEDVNIDDISCVVIEFRDKDRKVTVKDIGKSKKDVVKLIRNAGKSEIGDPRRGSLFLPQTIAPVMI